MTYMHIALAIFLLISILLSLKSFISKRSAIQIVNDMGQGWNLANTFDSFTPLEKITNPDDQITFFGNPIPTELMVTRIKKYGFKTVRLPVTWMNFIDESDNVNSEWMSRVREVVDWIINANMYCIINIHHDGVNENWLSEGLKARNKYIKLWSQIADEFKFYDDHLIFESMNEVEYKIGDNYDYLTLLNLTQAFVDTVRNSGGNNDIRLLLISGMDANLELSSSSEYRFPIDPSRKLAISLHYYLPSQFAIEPDDNPWYWIDNGIIREIPSMKTWGTDNNYKDLVSNFEAMKKLFVDKGIAVIISEIGVLTEQQKEPESIREYLYATFSLSADYNGIMACLWDTSKKTAGDMNYFNREEDLWYDEKIKDNFKKISKGKYVKPTDFYVITNTETVDNVDESGSLVLNIGVKKVITIIFNANISTKILYDVGFGISTYNKYGGANEEGITGSEGKKQYDGSYTFTIDATNKEYYSIVKISKWWGNEHIVLNYLTLVFEEEDIFFNYKEYKKVFNN